MTVTRDLDRTRQLVTLKDHRMKKALAGLADAQAAARRAADRARESSERLNQAEGVLVGARRGLADDLLNAALRLACVDAAMRERGKAEAAENEAMHLLETARAEEVGRRRAVLVAQGKRDALTRQEQHLWRIVRRSDEERLAVEMEDAMAGRKAR